MHALKGKSVVGEAASPPPLLIEWAQHLKGRQQFLPRQLEMRNALNKSSSSSNPRGLKPELTSSLNQKACKILTVLITVWDSGA